MVLQGVLIAVGDGFKLRSYDVSWLSPAAVEVGASYSMPVALLPR